MKPFQQLFLSSLIGLSAFMLFKRGETDMIVLMAIIVGLLLFFSVVWRLMQWKNSPMAEEIRDRTITWWWMVAVFMLALSIHKIVSFVFLGFLCFASLREYFSMVSMGESNDESDLSFADRVPVFFCYLSIPVVMYLAYIEWYELFIILIPVYTFLLMPIVLILQNRAKGSMKSLGILSLGLMFFVHNLGHCLFMINIGPIVLLYCFTLTEVRDLLSFWVGKGLAKVSLKVDDGVMKNLLDYKVAPDVSPKKTWSAGIVSAIMIAGVSLVFVPILPDFPDGKVSYAYCGLIGFSIGILGLFGDLAFSMVKRDVGVKDSGATLPGHGGIIDRVDSLVFTIPVAFHLIYWAYF